MRRGQVAELQRTAAQLGAHLPATRWVIVVIIIHANDDGAWFAWWHVLSHWRWREAKVATRGWWWAAGRRRDKAC
jgi:hypothetical protein